jgi:hypothetical protein
VREPRNADNPARIFHALEKQDEAAFAGCSREQHVALLKAEYVLLYVPH